MIEPAYLRGLQQPKLDGSGLQAVMPPVVAHLFDPFRSCRADLLILADQGALHPGPTIYDSFWIRDSSVEAIACALAGDYGLASTQLGQYHLSVFNTGFRAIGAAEVAELWAAFDCLKAATAGSIRWVLGEERARGLWETFVPTGPGDVGRLDSTMVGALCYFHPTRSYHGAKLGADVDAAFRFTLETIWSHFVRGGFRHDAAWHAYGPNLTLQLAHAFLLLGDLDRMDAGLGWSVGNAAFARIGREDSGVQEWQPVSGAWNEQHAYPIASGLTEIPDRWWYLGDLPHGWAAAECNLLLRDMLFFEAGEDADPHLSLVQASCRGGCAGTVDGR
jgi:hypothetical protein